MRTARASSPATARRLGPAVNGPKATNTRPKKRATLDPDTATRWASPDRLMASMSASGIPSVSPTRNPPRSARDGPPSLNNAKALRRTAFPAAIHGAEPRSVVWKRLTDSTPANGSPPARPDLDPIDPETKMASPASTTGSSANAKRTGTEGGRGGRGGSNRANAHQPKSPDLGSVNIRRVASTGRGCATKPRISASRSTELRPDQTPISTKPATRNVPAPAGCPTRRRTPPRTNAAAAPTTSPLHPNHRPPSAPTQTDKATATVVRLEDGTITRAVRDNRTPVEEFKGARLSRVEQRVSPLRCRRYPGGPRLRKRGHEVPGKR